MLNAKIYASSIANLTDARYFAAWGVDYLGYCLDESQADYVSPAKVREMVEWVEGPASVGEFVESPAHMAAYMLEEAGLTRVCHWGSEELSSAEQICVAHAGDEVAEGSVVVWGSGQAASEIDSDTARWIQAVAQHSSIYLDVAVAASEVGDFLRRMGGAGLLVRGGAEEKVGYKSYEDLDELFEALAYD